VSARPAEEHGVAVDQIRILIADRNAEFRDGVRNLLESETGFEVVGSTGEGPEVWRLIEELRPDIVLIDLQLIDTGAIDLLRSKGNGDGATRIVAMASGVDSKQVVAMVRTGVRGVLLKDAVTRLLFKSIRDVMAGEYWLDRESTTELVDTLKTIGMAPIEPPRDRQFKLTPREREIVNEIAAGRSNRDIAQKFQISEQTVKHHLTKVFGKVGVTNRLALALLALQHRIT
jgi:DNA-binding NarL/FixJ family response regulator